MISKTEGCSAPAQAVWHICCKNKCQLMEHALMIKERAKCILLHVPVELGSGQLETHSHRQAVLEVSTRC